MDKFVPKKKEVVVNQIKDLLLSGDIIRYDEHKDYIEVLSRNAINDLKRMGNLEEEGTTIKVPPEVVTEILTELKKDYLVQTVLCEHSGKYYYAYGAYLE